MTEERVERRLAAILVADVVGYSALIRADEEGTRAAVRQHNAETVEPQIAAYNGRIFKTVGDGLLAEFASVVDAVRCAVEIQNAIKDHNTEIAAEKRVEFRIGVNLGDVIAEGDDLHGDGVNVAARLEGLADPQGICISSSAFEQVRDKLEIGFEDLGDKQVKNIDRPIRVYRVLTDPAAAGTIVAAPTKQTTNWTVPAIAAALVVIIAAGGLAWWQPWVEPAISTKPDKPSIAVLPFQNLSESVDNKNIGGALADGLTTQIITSLAKLETMFVISQAATRSYASDERAPLGNIANELGVRFVLDGSVLQSGDRARISAQLIDASTDQIIWADNFDSEVDDVLALQDKITLNVLEALEVKLTEGAGARLQRGNTTNLQAYQLVRRGLITFRRLTKEDNLQARRLGAEAAKLDPDYTLPLFLIGISYAMSAQRGWSEDVAHDLALARELAQKILDIDKDSAPGYVILSNISLAEKRFDEAIDHAQTAHELAPNAAIIAGFLGYRLTIAGRAEEALPILQRATQLSANALPNVLMWEGRAYYALGRYEEAIASFEGGTKSGPKSMGPRAWLALTYAEVGRTDEARTEANELLKISPSFSAGGWLKFEGFIDAAEYEKRISALREIGLQE